MCILVLKAFIFLIAVSQLRTLVTIHEHCAFVPFKVTSIPGICVVKLGLTESSSPCPGLQGHHGAVAAFKLFIYFF